jgi:hypothetical protein
VPQSFLGASDEQRAVSHRPALLGVPSLSFPWGPSSPALEHGVGSRVVRTPFPFQRGRHTSHCNSRRWRGIGAVGARPRHRQQQQATGVGTRMAGRAGCRGALRSGCAHRAGYVTPTRAILPSESRGAPAGRQSRRCRAKPLGAPEPYNTACKAPGWARGDRLRVTASSEGRDSDRTLQYMTKIQHLYWAWLLMFLV